MAREGAHRWLLLDGATPRRVRDDGAIFLLVDAAFNLKIDKIWRFRIEFSILKPCEKITLKAAFLNSGTLFPGQTALQAVFLDSLLSFGHCQTPSPAIVLFVLISSLNSAQAVCAAGRRSCART